MASLGLARLLWELALVSTVEDVASLYANSWLPNFEQTDAAKEELTY